MGWLFRFTINYYKSLWDSNDVRDIEIFIVLSSMSIVMFVPLLIIDIILIPFKIIHSLILVYMFNPVGNEPTDKE